MHILEESRARYQAYLLRLWCEPQDTVWRASLTTTAGDQEFPFANLDDLFVYLLRQTEAMNKQRRKFPVAQGETMMATDDVQFTPQNDALHFVIRNAAIAAMTRKGEATFRNEDIQANADLITAALNNVGLAPGYIGARLGLAFATALIRRREDIYNADTGDGIYWPISWQVFGSLIATASSQVLDFPTLREDITSELADSLQAWHAPLPL